MSLCNLFIGLGFLTFYPYLIIGIIIGIVLHKVYLRLKTSENIGKEKSKQIQTLITYSIMLLAFIYLRELIADKQRKEKSNG